MLGFEAKQLEAIGFDYILNQLTPDSPYGRERVKQIAFMDEAALESSFDYMEKIISYFSDYEKTRTILALFKDIRKSISKTEPLSQVEIFEIKGFLINLEKLEKTIPDSNIFHPMDEALAIVDPSGLRIPTFTIESPLLFSIRKEKLKTDPLSIGWQSLIEQETTEENHILRDMSLRLQAYTRNFLSNMNIIGELDFTMAKTRLALEHGANRPVISKRGVLSFKEMNNPYIADAHKDKPFTKVSIQMEKGVTIITGANMGGKSVALKTAMLNTLLCRTGFFVFAQKAEVPLFDGVCMISEDTQDITRGLSSFGAEMMRINEIIARIKSEFLFIALDEPARGTNPEEGAIIVRAIANHFAKYNSVTMLATHYNRVTSLRFKHYQVAGVKTTSMDYNLIEAPHDAPPPQDAIKICKIIGLDKNLLAEIVAQHTAP